MNKLMKNTLWILMLTLFCVACADDKDPIYTPEESTAPVLSGPEISLDRDNENNILTFSWTQARYNIELAPTYRLALVTESVETILYEGKATTYEMTIAKLNQKLLNDLSLNPGEEVAVKLRVSSILQSDLKAHVSNALEYKVSPYSTSFPPIFMTGEAVGGWNWEQDVIVPSSKPNTYMTLAHFESGKSFRFFAQRNWGPVSYNYPYFTKVSELFENANDGDQNFKFVGESAWYRVTVDMKAKSINMQLIEEPLMYMTGAAVGGWDWNTNQVKMRFVQEGIWQVKTEFIKGEAFRFFAQKDWGPTSYNYPYFTKVSESFVNAEDGDKNFKFVGKTGEYTVTINLNDKEISLE